MAEIGSCVQVVKHTGTFSFLYYFSGGGAWSGVGTGWGGHKASDGCAPRPPLWAFTGTIYSDPHSRETFNIGHLWFLLCGNTGMNSEISVPTQILIE